MSMPTSFSVSLPGFLMTPPPCSRGIPFPASFHPCSRSWKVSTFFLFSIQPTHLHWVASVNIVAIRCLPFLHFYPSTSSGLHINVRSCWLDSSMWVCFSAQKTCAQSWTPYLPLSASSSSHSSSLRRQNHHLIHCLNWNRESNRFLGSHLPSCASHLSVFLLPVAVTRGLSQSSVLGLPELTLTTGRDRTLWEFPLLTHPNTPWGQSFPLTDGGIGKASFLACSQDNSGM